MLISYFFELEVECEKELKNQQVSMGIIFKVFINMF